MSALRALALAALALAALGRRSDVANVRRELGLLFTAVRECRLTLAEHTASLAGITTELAQLGVRPAHEARADPPLRHAHDDRVHPRPHWMQETTPWPGTW